MKRLVAIIFVFCALSGFAQKYTVTDLGTLGGSFAFAIGINDSGEVVGYSAFANPPPGYGYSSHAFLYSNGTMTDLGTLGGASSYAEGINGSGEVVGSSYILTGNIFGDLNSHAFLYSNGMMKDLGTLGSPYDDLSDSFAQAINASGQVVGGSNLPGDIRNYTSHAFLYSNGTMTDLGTLGGTSSYANGINDSGQVVGVSSLPGDSAYHAFLYNNGAMKDLGTLGASTSSAYGINDSGQVVGASGLPGNSGSHTFLYSNGTMTDLGTLGGCCSEGYGINASGEVVGRASISGYPAWVTVAFLYISSKGMTDLNTLIPTGSGWTLYSAQAINDKGQIAALGLINGSQHAFLLTPITPYKAFIQQPIKPDGSSVFKANRGVIPVKFTLTKDNLPTCDLPPATIPLTRTAGGTLGLLNLSKYAMPADDGANFRIDPTDCQYIYNLAASNVGAGVYRVDISIDGNVVGNAVFTLN